MLPLQEFSDRISLQRFALSVCMAAIIQEYYGEAHSIWSQKEDDIHVSELKGNVTSPFHMHMTSTCIYICLQEIVEFSLCTVSGLW